MPNLTPLQSAFVSGELSPELLARPNLVLAENNIYNRGVRELQNFWTDPRGPIRSRDGFRYIGAVLADDAPPPGEQCAESVYYDSGSALFSQASKNLDYSPNLGYIAASVEPTNGFAGGQTLVIFDVLTGGVVFSYGNCTRHGHKIISPINPLPEERGTWLARTTWPCGSGTRFLALADMTDNFNQIGAVSFSSNNQRIRAERNSDIILSDETTRSRYALIDKTNWSDTGRQYENVPGGWQSFGAAAINIVPPSFVEDRYLLCMWNGTQFGFVEYISGAINTPTVLLNPVDGDNFITFMSNPVVVNDIHIWWMFDTGQVGKPRQYLIRTDLDGSNQLQVPMFDDQIIQDTGAGEDRLFYEPANESLYYMYNETFWRYEIPTGQYYQCTPPYDQSVVSPNNRGGSLLRIDGNLWVPLNEVGSGPDTWGMEKIEAYF